MGKHSVNRQLLLYGIVIIFNVQGNHPNEQLQLKERPTKYQASLGQLLDKNTNTAVDLALGKPSTTPSGRVDRFVCAPWMPVVQPLPCRVFMST